MLHQAFEKFMRLVHGSGHLIVLRNAHEEEYSLFRCIQDPVKPYKCGLVHLGVLKREMRTHNEQLQKTISLAPPQSPLRIFLTDWDPFGFESQPIALERTRPMMWSRKPWKIEEAEFFFRGHQKTNGQSVWSAFAFRRGGREVWLMDKTVDLLRYQSYVVLLQCISAGVAKITDSYEQQLSCMDHPWRSRLRIDLTMILWNLPKDVVYIILDYSASQLWNCSDVVLDF
jgi:hypothetical protein